MKVGDKVYVICNDRRTWENNKICTISKVGKMYFELDEVGPWYKFCVDSSNVNYGNYSVWARGGRKGDKSADFQWYPSEEHFTKINEDASRRFFVSENLSLLTNEEIFDLYQLIKERGGK